MDYLVKEKDKPNHDLSRSELEIQNYNSSSEGTLQESNVKKVYMR